MRRERPGGSRRQRRDDRTEGEHDDDRPRIARRPRPRPVRRHARHPIRRSRPTASAVGVGRDAPGPDRGHQRLVIALVLVGVGLGERGHRTVEAVAAAEVARDRDAVAGAGVRARERPAADLAVGGSARGGHRVDVGRALRVPELADVEVAPLAVDVPRRRAASRGRCRSPPASAAGPRRRAGRGCVARLRAGERLEHRRLPPP